MKFTNLLRKALPLKPCGAVIVAAGTASRMGGIDKMFADLDGEPVLARTIRTFVYSDVIREIVVVTRPDLLEQVRELCRNFGKVRSVVAGGDTRQASVSNGLAALSDEVELVAVQDGARPLVSLEVIDRTVRAAHSYGAAAPAVPVKDTIKVAESGLAVSTPDRSKLRAVQTPQVFDKDLLAGALLKADREKAVVTDDCSAVERLGIKVKLVEGDEKNLKITTPIDLYVAKLLLEESK